LAKLFATFAFITFVLVASFSDPVTTSVHAFSSGPPAGHTGAPAELTCNACHTGSLNSGPGEFEILAPATYEPGETYAITVRHRTTDNSRRRWGFELTALDSSNDRIGTIQAISPITFVVNNDGPDGTRQYISHVVTGTFAGQTGGASWTFNWIAPDEDLGPVTFYAAGNQANNNGNFDGDQTYTARTTMLTGPPVIESAEVSGKKLRVFGENFAVGATLFVNGVKQKKTSNDANDPNTLIVAKKAGKTIQRGGTVSLEVQNPGGERSEAFLFTRP
jgi:hypothetical protein